MKGRELSGRAVIKLLRKIGYQPKQNVRTIWRESVTIQSATDREIAELKRIYNALPLNKEKL